MIRAHFRTGTEGLMSFLFELFPLIAFFVAYKIGGIYVATAAIILSVVLQVGYRLARREKMTPLQKASAVVLLALGGLTLLLHDDRFIVWKPTVYYWLVATALIVGQLVTGQPMLEKVIGDSFKLSHERWTKLSWIWAGVFAILGVLNLLVAYNFSLDTWVKFKFVLLGLFFIFVFAQGWWIVARWDGLGETQLEPTDTPPE
jgi:intracellular septation protein